MNQRFVLFYTGAPRQSGINNWEVFKQHINGDKHVIRNFAEISRIAQEMRRALLHANWDDVERLLHEEWKLRRTNAPGNHYATYRQTDRGCHAGTALGRPRCAEQEAADVSMVLVEEGSRERVQDAIRKNGGQPLDFQVARARTSISRASSRRHEKRNHVHRRRRDGCNRYGLLCFPRFCRWCLSCGRDSAAAVAGDHVLRFEAIFRPLLAVAAAGNLQLAV